MCTAKKPTVQRSAPPPMSIPTTVDENVQNAGKRERRRAASAYGRESTILGMQGGGGLAAVSPTTQQKNLLGM
jgi:hypothetical protein